MTPTHKDVTLHSTYRASQYVAYLLLLQPASKVRISQVLTGTGLYTDEWQQVGVEMKRDTCYNFKYFIYIFPYLNIDLLRMNNMSIDSE